MEMKMTKAQMFEVIKAETTNEEIKAFCDHELALLASKAEKAKGKTSKHKSENDIYRKAILATLAESGSALTVAQITEKCSALAGMSNQKVTGLLTTLAQKHGTGEIIRSEYKRVAYYELAPLADEDEDDSAQYLPSEVEV